MPSHPRDRFIPVYGRQPVREVLMDRSLRVDKVRIADSARGEIIDDIEQLAAERGLDCQRAPERVVHRLSKNGRQDQGVVADVVAPRMSALEPWLEQRGSRPTRLLALDGVTTPRNVGMVIRSATAAGVDGIVLGRKGTAGLSPLVIKSSAGVVFKATILRTAHMAQALGQLRAADFAIWGLSGGARTGLIGAAFPERAVLVLGSESAGISTDCSRLVTQWASLPMRQGVESLNVACAATLACYELMRTSFRGAKK